MENTRPCYLWIWLTERGRKQLLNGVWLVIFWWFSWEKFPDFFGKAHNFCLVMKVLIHKIAATYRVKKSDIIHKVPIQEEKVYIWCAMGRERIIGPIFFNRQLMPISMWISFYIHFFILINQLDLGSHKPLLIVIEQTMFIELSEICIMAWKYPYSFLFYQITKTMDAVLCKM